VWALVRIDDPAARPVIVKALADASPDVQHAAAHAAGLLRERSAVEPLGTLLAAAEGGPAARAAAEALGRIGGPRAAELLLAACPRAGDRATEHSLTFALIECGEIGPLEKALAAGDPRTRRAALVALDQLADLVRPGEPPSAAAAPPAATPAPSPPLKIPALGSHVIAACRADDPGLRDAGWWIAGRHPEMAAALAADVPAAVARAAGAADEAPRIVARFARLAANPAIAAALADVCRSGPADAARIAREVMRTARPQKTPDGWIDALAAALAADGANAADILDTLARLAIAPEQRPRIRPAALALAAAAKTPPKLRVLAAQAGGPEAGLPDDVLARLVQLVQLVGGDADTSPLDRSAAVAVLVAARPASATLLALAPTLARLPANDVSQLLPLYIPAASAAAPGAAAAPLSRAVAAVAEHPDLAAVSREAVAACVAALPEEQRGEGAALLARADAARAGVRGSFERLAAALPPGDAARGHAVFMSSKAACAGCHAMAYVGGRIGPDLSKIGGIRTPRDLLEAIVLPSASFVRSYEPVTVLTADGRAFQGVVRDDTATEVVLQVSATAQERIPRPEIESIAPGAVSLMPKGYDTILSPQELADLVAFLARAR
jgi:putative heme-binding domain-containing protein